jgi:hypothetical protein
VYSTGSEAEKSVRYVIASRCVVKIVVSFWARESGGATCGAAAKPGGVTGREGGSDRRPEVICSGSRVHTGPAPRSRWASRMGVGGTSDGVEDTALLGLSIEGACEGPGVCVSGIDSPGRPSSLSTRFGVGRTSWSPRTIHTVAAVATENPITARAHQSRAPHAPIMAPTEHSHDFPHLRRANTRR